MKVLMIFMICWSLLKIVYGENYMGKNMGNVMKFFMEFLKSRRNLKNGDKKDRAAQNFQKRKREQKNDHYMCRWSVYIV